MRQNAFSLAALVATSLAAHATGFGKAKPPPPPLPKGTQIGVVNLLNGEVMHYHAATNSTDTFLKIQRVGWPIDDMLLEALQEPATQLGLNLKKLDPIDVLQHSRESCFVDASLADGLPKSCAAPLSQQAASGGVGYLIVMAPGLNDANHAGKLRIENVSAMMRGWGFQTSERAGAKDQPTLFNEIELLLIRVGPDGVTLRARQWGGRYFMQWQTYTLPADLRSMPAEQLEQLQPLYATMLSKQVNDLLAQVQVEP
jgi:hypothetical protein